MQRAAAEGRPEPDFRPKSTEARRLRRARALAREADELRVAAQEKREREALEPAYMAKAQAELFETKQARAEGASAEEAFARAKAAGELAFDTALADVNGSRVAQDAYEARMEERRAAAAKRAQADEAKAQEVPQQDAQPAP
jgi:hypothetical protein